MYNVQVDNQIHKIKVHSLFPIKFIIKRFLHYNLHVLYLVFDGFYTTGGLYRVSKKNGT